ncbi:MAG: energy transducer TonB [Acidobacteria bacterium]|nr:energy transducer TonB [Acidobacteriota bacterium]
MLRVLVTGLLAAVSLGAQDNVQHLRLAQTKVSQLVLHREDAQITQDIAGDDPLPIFFQVVIGTNGEVVSAVPLRGQPAAAIKPAEETLKSWRWKPIQYQGKPAAIDTIVAVHFGMGDHKAKPRNGWFPEGLMYVEWNDAQNLKADTKMPALPAGGTPGGKVLIYATLTEKGELQNLAVADAPDPVLGKAALTEVKKWKFHALVLDDKAIAIDTRLEVKFPKK